MVKKSGATRTSLQLVMAVKNIKKDPKRGTEERRGRRLLFGARPWFTARRRHAVKDPAGGAPSAGEACT